MHETLRRLHGGQRSRGTTIDRFRLNELISQAAFGGRRGRVYRRIVALSGVRPGDTALDVGCSSGYLARKLAATVGSRGRVTGVDPSSAAIGHARAQASPVLSYTVGTAQALPLPDATFDVVTCTLALHHVPVRSRPLALAEMYRVTKPGGRLLLADFDPARTPLPLHPGARRMRRAAAATGSLAGLATAAGYQVESTGTLPLLRYVTAVRPVSRGRGPAGDVVAVAASRPDQSASPPGSDDQIRNFVRNEARSPFSCRLFCRWWLLGSRHRVNSSREEDPSWTSRRDPPARSRPTTSI